MKCECLIWTIGPSSEGSLMRMVVCITVKDLEFYGASEIFLMNLHAFIQSHAQSGNKRKLYKKNKDAGDWYQLYYSDREARLVAELMYEDSDNLRLNRKYNKYIEIKNG